MFRGVLTQLPFIFLSAGRNKQTKAYETPTKVSASQQGGFSGTRIVGLFSAEVVATDISV